jgi:hypothetical protein
VFAILTCASVRADVLYIGDSHNLGTIPDTRTPSTFGDEVVALLSARPGFENIDRYAVEGSSAWSWMHNGLKNICYQGQAKHCDYNEYAVPDPQRGPSKIKTTSGAPYTVPSLPAILAKKSDYSVYVFALGTNDAGGSQCSSFFVNGKPRGVYAESIAAMISKVPSGVPCVWIGPPNYQAKSDEVKACGTLEKYQAWVNDLEKFVTSTGKCKFARDPDHPKGTGLHFETPQLAIAAAKAVVAQIGISPAASAPAVAPVGVDIFSEADGH